MLSAEHLSQSLQPAMVAEGAPGGSYFFAFSCLPCTTVLVNLPLLRFCLFNNEIAGKTILTFGGGGALD